MNRLKELRLEKGLRQKDVAQKIGVSTQSYGYYENWVNKPDPETLIKLADLFEVSIDYLLGRNDNFNNELLHSVELSYTDEERQFVADFRALNASGQKLVKDVIKNLQAGSRAADQGANTVNSATNKRA